MTENAKMRMWALEQAIHFLSDNPNQYSVIEVAQKFYLWAYLGRVKDERS